MKRYRESKTLWVNGGIILLTIVLAVLRQFGVEPLAEVPPELAPAVPLAVAAVNFVLRLVTRQPVGTPPATP